MATPKHSKHFLLENHLRIVALATDLQTVSFNSVKESLQHSSTTKLLLLLVLNKRSI